MVAARTAVVADSEVEDAEEELAIAEEELALARMDAAVARAEADEISRDHEEAAMLRAEERELDRLEALERAELDDESDDEEWGGLGVATRAVRRADADAACTRSSAEHDAALAEEAEEAAVRAEELELQVEELELKRQEAADALSAARSRARPQIAIGTPIGFNVNPIGPQRGTVDGGPSKAMSKSIFGLLCCGKGRRRRGAIVNV